jgi:hypothetical protein
MTQPPPGWPSGQPQDPQYGGWQPPPPAPGGWSAPQQPGPPAGWPQTPQQPGDAGRWPQQPGQDPAWGALPPAPPKSQSRGKLIASAAVVVAIVAGGAVTYVALSDSNSTGAGSPKAAVQSVITDLNQSDLIGVLDDLAPGERAALANPALDEINQLKRLKMLQPSADPKNLSGVTFAAKDLTFNDKTVSINDHVRIVELTGGTLDLGGDATKVPFTKEFLDAAFPHGLPPESKGSSHVDIAKEIRANGQGPVRIATQRVGGKWYPSIFYTAADAAAKKAVPTASDAIPAAGASSPQEAVNRMVKALMQADPRSAIALLSPDEDAVMHDYGGLFLKRSGSYDRPDFTIKELNTTAHAVSGGATRVLLSSVTVASNNGDETTLRVDGSCIEVSAKGDHKRMCTSDFVTEIINSVGGFGVPVNVTTAQRQALADLLGGLTKIGIDTTQSGGQWYVNPVRSYLDVSGSILSGLKDNDLLELIRFFSSLGSH